MAHVLISGGTRGIGAAISRKFRSEGYEVTALFASDESSAKKMEEEGITVFKVDVSDPLAVKELASKIGPVDVLISNAGISVTGLADLVTYEDYRKVMDTNFGGLFNLVHEFVHPMISRKEGVIIAMSSMWGQVGASCESIYSASKGAVDAYVKSLAKELGPSNIRVNAVSPGVIRTSMLDVFTEEDLQAAAEETPLQRLGKPEDVAELVYYLATPASSFITGQVYGVNGGFIV